MNKNIIEAIAGKIISPFRITPTPSGSKKKEKNNLQTGSDFFKKLEVINIQDKMALKITHASGAMYFLEKDDAWKVTKEKDQYIECTMLLKWWKKNSLFSSLLNFLFSWKKRTFFFHFHSKADRNLIFALFQKFI